MGKYIVELMRVDSVDIEFFDTLEEANEYATDFYNQLSEYDKKRYSVQVGYVEPTAAYYPESELEYSDNFDWYSFHSFDIPEGAIKKGKVF